MTSTDLSTNWLFKAAGELPFHRPQIQTADWLLGNIPGHIHRDLVDNGIIADPFTDRHEIGCAWVDDTDWTYQTEFDFQPSDELPTRALRFEGLDTVCAIFLNDDLIASHDNMFVPLELDVSSKLRTGKNSLRVEFKSAVKTGIERRKKFFEEQSLPWDTVWFDERAFVRKAGYMSGWDWGPRLVSCGIWKPVQLLQYRSRIKSFHVHTEPLANGAFRLRTETIVEGDDQPKVQFASQTYDGDLDIVVESPELWWPNGYGAPTLHEISAILESGHRVNKKIGFRTIELTREPDSQGESFDFVVNEKKIWARGANWIPNDSFPSRITDRDYKRQVETCQELNMNMLRVWGGGLYESDAFYDACDENGILVWQDFPYACSYYPDDDAACASADQEAHYQIERLRDRTSLALWCGNNENLVLWESQWGGKEKSPPLASMANESITKSYPRQYQSSIHKRPTSFQVRRAPRFKPKRQPEQTRANTATSIIGMCGTAAAIGSTTPNQPLASPPNSALQALAHYRNGSRSSPGRANGSSTPRPSAGTTKPENPLKPTTAT